MTNLKPILVIATMFLAVVMLWQVASITGFLTNETIPANVTIGNVAPTVATITCGSSNVVTPVACTNVTVDCWAVINDNNGANDISSVKGELYNGTAGCTSEDQDACYYSSNCTVFAVVNGTARNYTCSFTFRHFAYNDLNWTSRMNVTDASASAASNTITPVQVQNLTAIDVVETYTYFGSIALGATSAEQTVTTTNCGNYVMSVNVSGTNLPCDSQGTITVGQIKYNLTAAQPYASSTALTTSSVDTNLNVARGTTDALSQGSTYWLLQAPATGVKGLCAGNMTFYAIRG